MPVELADLVESELLPTDGCDEDTDDENQMCDDLGTNAGATSDSDSD